MVKIAVTWPGLSGPFHAATSKSQRRCALRPPSASFLAAFIFIWHGHRYVPYLCGCTPGARHGRLQTGSVMTARLVASLLYATSPWDAETYLGIAVTPLTV